MSLKIVSRKVQWEAFECISLYFLGEKNAINVNLNSSFLSFLLIVGKEGLNIEQVYKRTLWFLVLIRV